MRLRRHRTLEYEFGSAPRATWKMNLVVPEFNTAFETRYAISGTSSELDCQCAIIE